MEISDYTGGGDYLFAKNLSGIEFRLLETTLYDDDDDDCDDLPEEMDVHGKWLRVETEHFDDGYLSAVGELIEELKRHEAEAGDLFEVTRCEKSGRDQTDPYEVNVEALEPDQSRL